jgi:hypothetical protein
MLKRATRIVAVGGALLALAVVGAAWLHWDGDKDFGFATPRVVVEFKVWPEQFDVGIFLRHEAAPLEELRVGKYGLISEYEDRSGFNPFSRVKLLLNIDDEAEWSGFGYWRGHMPGAAAPCFAGVYCSTWFLIAVLTLPSVLRVVLGWRKRKLVKPGCCINCGYDLRATPDKCPECGRAVGINAG